MFFLTVSNFVPYTRDVALLSLRTTDSNQEELMKAFRLILTILIAMTFAFGTVACEKKEEAKEEPTTEEPATDEPATEEPAEEEAAEEEAAPEGEEGAAAEGEEGAAAEGEEGAAEEGGEGEEPADEAASQ
jgi:hypothetical protein